MTVLRLAGSYISGVAVIATGADSEYWCPARASVAVWISFLQESSCVGWDSNSEYDTDDEAGRTEGFEDTHVC